MSYYSLMFCSLSPDLDANEKFARNRSIAILRKLIKFFKKYISWSPLVVKMSVLVMSFSVALHEIFKEKFLFFLYVKTKT